jgi:hypothetical protein
MNCGIKAGIIELKFHPEGSALIASPVTAASPADHETAHLTSNHESEAHTQPIISTTSGKQNVLIPYTDYWRQKMDIVFNLMRPLISSKLIVFQSSETEAEFITFKHGLRLNAARFDLFGFAIMNAFQTFLDVVSFCNTTSTYQSTKPGQEKYISGVLCNDGQMGFPLQKYRLIYITGLNLLMLGVLFTNVQHYPKQSDWLMFSTLFLQCMLYK